MSSMTESLLDKAGRNFPVDVHGGFDRTQQP
jgi:hypothetical protein